MGLFKDLNFKNRNGVLVSPDSEKLGGYTLSEVKSQIKPTFVNIGGGTLSKASITSANLPTTLHKDSSWTQYKPVAYNFVDLCADTINTNDIFSDGSCIATYTFNGNANDLSGNYNGVETSITYSTGLIGQCATFNGTTSLLKVSNASRLYYSNNNAISFWFKKNGDMLAPTGNTNAIFCRGGAGESLVTNWDAFGIQTSSTTSTNFMVLRENTSFSNFEYTLSIPNYNICDGKWHNIIINFPTPTSLDLYIDAKHVGNISNMIPQTTTAPDLYFNYNNNSANIFYMEQVRIFNRILTADEILTLYKEPSAKPRKLIINNVEQSIISETLPVDTTNTHDIFGDGSCKATYQFNGNANDLGNNYNGTATSITYGTGKFGQCAVFNGTSSYISPGFNFNLNSQDFTISLFTKFTTTNESYILGHLWNASQTTSGLYERFYISSINGKINVCFSQIGALPNTEYLSSLSLLNDGNFHHVTIVYVSSNKKVFLYVDGILQGSKVYTISSNTKVFTPTFGKVFRTDGATQYQYFFNGSIDQVRIFNRVLTDYEIGILYKETKPAITTFGTVLTNEKDLQIKVEGNADIVELNFVEGV